MTSHNSKKNKAQTEQEKKLAVYNELLAECEVLEHQQLVLRRRLEKIKDAIRLAKTKKVLEDIT